MPRHVRAPARLLAPLVSATLALALAAPAAAYLRDFQLFEPPIRGHNGRTLMLTCPGGKLLLGMGANITPVAVVGSLAINKMSMTAGRADQAQISGANTDVGHGPWTISGQVFCASYTDVAPTAANGGPYLKNFFIPRTESDVSSLTFRTATAQCGGRKPVGGGFAILSPPGGGNLPQRPPPPAHVVADSAKVVGNGFAVRARETQAVGANWSVAAYAICANYIDPTLGRIYVGPGPLIYTQTTPASSVNKGGGAACPQNFFVIGGGARIVGAGGGTPPPQVVLKESSPGLRQWTANAHEENPTSASWQLETKVVCAPFVFQS